MLKNRNICRKSGFDLVLAVQNTFVLLEAVGRCRSQKASTLLILIIHLEVAMEISLVLLACYRKFFIINA